MGKKWGVGFSNRNGNFALHPSKHEGQFIIILITVMKNYLLLLLCVFCLSFVSVEDTQAQHQNCWPDCEFVASGSGSETFEVPGYPGCSVTYVYSWRRCSDGKVYFGERKIYWQFPVGDCDDYFDALYDGTNINKDFANWIMEVGLTKVQEKLFLNEYNNAAPWNKYLYECPNGKQHYYGVKASCASFVLKIRYSFYIPPFGYINVYELSMLSCDETSCCVKKTSICYNTSTQQTEITESWEHLPTADPDCHLDTPPTPPSGGTIVHQSPCVVLCGQ